MLGQIFLGQEDWATGKKELSWRVVYCQYRISKRFDSSKKFESTSAGTDELSCENCELIFTNKMGFRKHKNICHGDLSDILKTCVYFKNHPSLIDPWKGDPDSLD